MFRVSSNLNITILNEENLSKRRPNCNDLCTGRRIFHHSKWLLTKIFLIAGGNLSNKPMKPRLALGKNIASFKYLK